MSEVIKVDNLIKSYDDNTVIKGISFTVNKGEIFALLGTNGAGKTTTLECVEGIRKYDSGEIFVNGKMGVQLQTSSLPVNIKPLEAMRLFCKWNGTKVDDEIIKTFNLTDIKNSQYKELSTGQKRRLHLALSLVNNPDIVFLDEPTAGLDVEGRVALHKEVHKLKEAGKTIVLASHDMAEVETLCDRIAILKDGVFAFTGTTHELIRDVKMQATIYLKTEKLFEAEQSTLCNYQGLKQDYAVFTAADIGESLLELLAVAKENGNTVVDVKVEKSTLEQRFMDIVEGRI